MRELVLLVFLLLCFAAYAQQGDDDETVESGETAQEVAESALPDQDVEQEPEPERSPVEEPVIEAPPDEVFIPTEEISEDKPVAFPVDI